MAGCLFQQPGLSGCRGAGDNTCAGSRHVARPEGLSIATPDWNRRIVTTTTFCIYACGWAFSALPVCTATDETGQQSVGGGSPVTAIAISPDGLAVTGSQSGLQIYEFRPRGPVASRLLMKTALTEIQVIRFSPDGKLLAVAGGTPAEAGVIEIFQWQTVTRNQSMNPLRMECHADVIMDVAWSASGNRLVTAALDNTWQVLQFSGDASRLMSLRKIEGHSLGVMSVNYISDELVLTASLDSTIRLWNESTGTLLRTLKNHRSDVYSTSVRPPDKETVLPLLASVSKDRTVRLWQPTIGRMVRFVQLDSIPLAVQWLQNGSRLVVACQDGTIRFIDPETIEVRRSCQAASARLWSMGVTRNGGNVLAGGADGRLYVVPSR